MAQKTTKNTAKKPVAKTTAAKKAPTKKVAAKKTTAKKATARATAATEKEIKMAAPEMQHECGCGNGCNCGADCKCHRRGGFVRFFKKLIIALILFALGFAAAKFFCCDKPEFRGPRAEFVNGCLDASSINCPKMLEVLPAMDINQDGCVTKDEYRLVKREMRREIREMEIEFDD